MADLASQFRGTLDIRVVLPVDRDGKPIPGPKALMAISASRTEGGSGQPGGGFCEVYEPVCDVAKAPLLSLT